MKNRRTINWWSGLMKVLEPSVWRTLILIKITVIPTEILLLTPPLDLIASNNQFSKIQPCQLLKVCCRDTMELYLPMARQAQAKRTPWREVRNGKISKVLFLELSITFSMQSKAPPIPKNIWSALVSSNSTTKN